MLNSIINTKPKLDRVTFEELMNFSEEARNLQVTEVWDYKKNVIEEWEKVLLTNVFINRGFMRE